MPQEILNYRIEREIGEGGMSRVYKGVDPKTGQQVAIKELLPHLSHHDEVRQRFCREAQVMAILNHPHIVRLIRYEEVGDNLYLVQEYVDGMNLARYVGEHRGALPEADAIRLFRQILEALSYAHEAGVVHRDIKPSNILLTPIGDVKILDFGIARIVGDESGGFRTKTGTRIGTVVYMSPEQVNAKADIDHRSDIYSAGVLLHHMLTGRAPYDMGTDSEFEVQMKIVGEPLPRMRDVNPGVSEQMQRIVDKATAKGRDARYQSCGAFLQALDTQPNPVDDPIFPDPLPLPQPNPSFTKIAIISACIIALLLGLNWMVTSQNASSSLSEQPVIEEPDSSAVDPLSIYLEGFEAYDGKEYEKAFSLYKKAAEAGYAPAQHNLGYMYQHGEGVEENDVEAVKWYRKAVEQGLAVAQYSLGYMYDNGEGVEENDVEAVKWYRKAVEQGLAVAQSQLGYMYQFGEGVEENDVEAVKWYRKAAEQGLAVAQYNLGYMYDNGEGVEESDTEAVKWYRNAAAQGQDDAKRRLEDMGLPVEAK